MPWAVGAISTGAPASTATASPWPTPAAASPPATRRARSCTCAHVCRIGASGSPVFKPLELRWALSYIVWVNWLIQAHSSQLWLVLRGPDEGARAARMARAAGIRPPSAMTVRRHAWPPEATPGGPYSGRSKGGNRLTVAVSSWGLGEPRRSGGADRCPCGSGEPLEPSQPAPQRTPDGFGHDFGGDVRSSPRGVRAAGESTTIRITPRAASFAGFPVRRRSGWPGPFPENG